MRRPIGKVIAGTAIAALAVLPPLSRTQQAPKPSFEVASIKANTSGGFATSLGMPGCRFVARNNTVRMLVQFAYGEPGAQSLNDRLIGGPNWITTDRFDIEGRPEDNSPVSQTDMRILVQALLEDRFQLRMHREVREVPVYDLVVSNNGPKMKLSEDQTQGTPQPISSSCAPPPTLPPAFQKGPNGEYLPVRGRMTLFGNPLLGAEMLGGGLRMEGLAGFLGGQIGRLVIDKTGLTALFDVRLRFSRETGIPAGNGAGGPSDPPSEPYVFTAVQDQLGLKLVSAKELVEFLVIDSVKKPTEN